MHACLYSARIHVWVRAARVCKRACGGACACVCIGMDACVFVYVCVWRLVSVRLSLRLDCFSCLCGGPRAARTVTPCYNRWLVVPLRLCLCAHTETQAETSAHPIQYVPQLRSQ